MLLILGKPQEFVSRLNFTTNGNIPVIQTIMGQSIYLSSNENIKYE
jgi:hypothetical protein